MNKFIPIALIAVVMCGQSGAVPNPGTRVKVHLKQKQYNPASQQLRMAKAEAKPVQSGRFTLPRTVNKRGQNPSTQASTLIYQDLGQSINPYTAIGGGRNYLSVVPELNTVALIRRGGPDDTPGPSNKPGDKLFYDINTKGGAEGKWQISKGLLFTNEIYPITTTNDFAPRYPQGLIFNPPGNTDTTNAIAMAITRVLDGSNDNWGGYGRGWKGLAPNAVQKQTLGSSGDVLHFRIESMISTSQGSVFTIEPEEQITGTAAADIIFTDKIMINRYKYNSTTQTFDSTTTLLPFANDQGDSASAVANTAIAFAPDGLHGYAVIAAYNKNYARNFGMVPYFSRTTDGGNTWSDFVVIDYNKSIYEKGSTSPGKDTFRDSLFVGNYVAFTDSTIFRADSSTQVGAHPVDYTMMDFDLAVDKNNQAHIFGTICVGGFGDTLELTGPGFFRPQNGSWNVVLTIPANSDVCKGMVLKRNEAVQGCWGDCAGAADDSFNELNRPQMASSADGSYFAFCWFDTDQEAHPQLTDDDNSNPDLWMRTMRVGINGELYLSPMNRNMSKNSDKDGQFFQGNIAPVMLNKTGGFEVAASMTVISDFINPPAPAVWPVQHLYVSGINVPASVDSFSQQPVGPLVILKTNENISSNVGKSLQMDLLPNPAGAVFSAHIEGLKSGSAEVRVSNLLGQVLESRTLSVPNGSLNIPFNLRTAPKGVYLLNIRNGKQNTTKRIVLE